MKLRIGDPWMTGTEYGHTLVGLSINLLVIDMNAALFFQTEVLGAEVVYSDPDFAVMTGYGGEWMVHADHTYDKHPFGSSLGETASRGLGIEIRLHGCDPDKAQLAAETLGFEVLVPAKDMGHGLREVYIQDPDGYTWVPDIVVEPES